MNLFLFSNCSHYSKYNSWIVPILFHAIFRAIHGLRETMFLFGDIYVIYHRILKLSCSNNRIILNFLYYSQDIFMAIPSSFEETTEGVPKRIPNLKLSDILSHHKFQTTSIVIPIYFQIISIKHPTTFPNFSRTTVFLNNHYFLQITTLAT